MKRRLALWLYARAEQLDPPLARFISASLKQQALDEFAAQRVLAEHRSLVAARASRQ